MLQSEHRRNCLISELCVHVKTLGNSLNIAQLMQSGDMNWACLIIADMVSAEVPSL